MEAFTTDDGQWAVGKRHNFTQLNVPIEMSDCVRDAISASPTEEKHLSCMDKITTHGSDNLKDVDFRKTQDLMKHALTSPVQEQVPKPKKDSEGFTKHDSSPSKIIRLYEKTRPKPQKQGVQSSKRTLLTFLVRSIVL
jgi:hypothetical protein